LGYHYGFLGLRFDAVQELERALAIDPNDSIAISLMEQFRQRAAPAPVQPASPEFKAPPAPAKPAERLEGPLLVPPLDQ